MENNDVAILATDRGDVLLADPDALPDIILNPDTEPQPMRSLPTYIPASQTSVRIRLIYGDMISGVIVDDNLPFKPEDKNTRNDGITAAGIQKILRTGQDSLNYLTTRGTLTGKRIRERFAFKPDVSDATIEISIRDIDALVTGDIPFPPPVSISPDMPALLCGMVFLPGAHSPREAERRAYGMNYQKSESRYPPST
jgi:hypothetical protein